MCSGSEQDQERIVKMGLGKTINKIAGIAEDVCKVAKTVDDVTKMIKDVSKNGDKKK